LVKPCFLAELSDSSTIVMRKHFVSKNGISDLGCIDKIHLKQTRLLSALIRSIVLERIKEESSRWLNHVLRKKYINDTIDIHETAAFFICKLIGEFSALFRIQSDDVLEEASVVGRVAGLLSIRNDLLELSGLCETCHNLRLT
jgi:hypothetical protein